MIGLTKEQYPYFVKDALRGAIVVGGTCTTGCIFCACNVSHKAINRSNWINFISKEDLISVIPMVGKLVHTPEIVEQANKDGIPLGISFGDGNYFSSCEPFLHPEYPQLIEIVNDYLPNYVKYTATVGKGINPDHYELFRRSNMSFYVSVNSMHQETRNRLMRSKDDFNSVKHFLKNAHDIIYRVSLMFSGDVDELKRDIEKLYKLHPSYENKSIRLWLPDYSKYSNDVAKQLYADAKTDWHEAVNILYSMNKQPLPSVPSMTDGAFPATIPHSEFHHHRKEFDRRIKEVIYKIHDYEINLQDVGFIIPESSWDYSKKWGEVINRIFAKNISFGGSYVISALLSKNDVVAAIKDKPYKYYVLPSEIFDEFGEDIAGNRIQSYGIDIFLG